MDTYMPNTKYEQSITTADVLRSIAKLVRRNQTGQKALRLADKVEALAMAVDLASRGVPGMARQAKQRAKELVAS